MQHVCHFETSTMDGEEIAHVRLGFFRFLLLTEIRLILNRDQTHPVNPTQYTTKYLVLASIDRILLILVVTKGTYYQFS